MKKVSAFALLTLLATASAQGQDVGTLVLAQDVTVVQEPASAASMMVGIDPRTGKLRALSDAEIAELAAQKPVSTPARSTPNAAWAAMPQTAAEAEKTLRVLPNGLSVATLPVSAMHSMTAQIGADGKLVISESSQEGHAHAS